ncbi:MAG: alcohol dehydrogenase catalytic domain-containing protein [Anaerolineae bacterium]|nr:alcohol dehydrogenase catalytic domain-containing protein [Candidatus Roseilinea sp.]MDW8448751.1 alcohol dehydrogenase catalytic domain-containing protein [Anaerolineae bacterium]
MKTKAIVIPAANTVELREVELKPLGADDVLIQTTLTSISAGTERMLLRGVMPHPMLQFPVVPGYETVGKVVEAGDNAKAWLGKRVYIGGNYGFVGVNPAFGGQSAYIVAPQSHLTDLQSLTDEQGVLLALAATALHGVDVAFGAAGKTKDEDGLRPPPSVLILGQGIVGQLAARFAKARGAHVTVTDKVASRLRLSAADVKLRAEDGELKSEDDPSFSILNSQF